jgi:hypothetical protein
MKSRFMVISGVLLAVAAIAVLKGTQARAQGDSTTERFQRFEAIGYQASSSSPLVFHGQPIGNNAIWHLQIGPLESSAIASIPSAPDPTTFGGADCRAEHSQAEIVTQDGSTLRVSVYGFRCEPNDPPTTSTATVNASTPSLRAAPHDSGPMWVATSHSCDFFIHYTSPV